MTTPATKTRTAYDHIATGGGHAIRYDDAEGASWYACGADGVTSSYHSLAPREVEAMLTDGTLHSPAPMGAGTIYVLREAQQ